MRVEIAICTCNRAAMLARTLQRLCEIDMPEHAVSRCLVIDNNCTDETSQIVESFTDRLNIRRLQEPLQGHVHARNRAVSAAEGDLMLWLDDDVLVADQWLSEYVRAAAEQPQVAFWGGPIIPRFERGRPAWIEQNWALVKGCFACRDLGDKEFDFTDRQLPYGANFAIRLPIQKQYRFAARLGRSGDLVLGEDELDLFRRLLADGRQGRWLPLAGVEHWIDAARASTRFIARYFEGQGQALVAKQQSWSNDPVELDKEATRELFWYRAKRWLAPSEVWLSHLIRSSLARGQAQALRPAKQLDPPSKDAH